MGLTVFEGVTSFPVLCYPCALEDSSSKHCSFFLSKILKFFYLVEIKVDANKNSPEMKNEWNLKS